MLRFESRPKPKSEKNNKSQMNEAESSYTPSAPAYEEDQFVHLKNLQTPVKEKKDKEIDKREYHEKQQEPIDQVVLNDVLNKSTLKHHDTKVQADKILKEFNQDITESAFTTSTVRGDWINPDEFLLGHRNKKAELAGFHHTKNIARALNVSPNIVTETLGRHKQNEIFYGAYGSYVLNVPPGKYAKAISGNTPLLFDVGPHVIHDPTFQFDIKNGLEDQAKPYIKHETFHILRVPAGKIAKVWIGSEPFLLEARRDPYVFNTPLFKLEKHSQQENDYFFNATERLIIHGSKKRIIPHTSEVAITYNNGTLEVIEPRLDSKPTIIDSPTHEVDGFLSTGIQTLLFPSEDTKKQRKLDNAKASADEVAYEIFTTKDSLKVGVKLLVAFRITNAQKALSLLVDKDGILSHIENLATVDMGKAIQKCSSQEFLCFYQTKPPKPESATLKELQSAISSTPQAPALEHFQDTVKNQLSSDLAEYGIELVRLNIETPKIMDAEIAKKMSEQSLKTAEASAQEAVLEQNFWIAKRRAEQEATTKVIAQQQVNESKISQAEAELKAAKLSSEALLIRADAEKKAAVLRGEQFNENSKLFELEKLRIQMDGYARMQFVPQQMMSPGMFGSPFSFFGAPTTSAMSMPSNTQDQQNTQTERPRLGGGGSKT